MDERQRQMRPPLLTALALFGACVGLPPSPPVDGPSTIGSSGEASTGVGTTTSSTTEGTSMSGSGGSLGSSTGEPTTTLPLDDGTSTTDPSTSGTSGSSGDPTTGGVESTTGGMPVCHPLLVEVYYDTVSGEDMEQWVELFNDCGADIDLGDYSLGWSGTDYTYGVMDLTGTIADGECLVVGGPVSSNDNANPILGIAMDFSPDIDKNGDPGKGVALFFGSAASIMPDTIPVDAVIYGYNNDSMLLDANGDTPPPHVSDAGDQKSIRRTAVAGPTWIVDSNPEPNVCPPF